MTGHTSLKCSRVQARAGRRRQPIKDGRLALILWAAISLFALLLLAEGAQLVLPNRLASLADVTWGAVGIVVDVPTNLCLCLRPVAPYWVLEPECDGS